MKRLSEVAAFSMWARMRRDAISPSPSAIACMIASCSSGIGGAVRLAQLRAPEGVQAVAHGDRLFGKEAIVGGVIDGFMELAVEAVIGIEIAGLDDRL